MNKHFLCTLACLLPSWALCAQSFSVNWHKVGGGGGTSTGGVYSISGVAGQHDAGTMAGGSFVMAGGFWSQLVVTQTASAPVLSIALSSTNTILISWPSSTSSGFVLQNNPDLRTSNWVAAPVVPADDGTNRTVVIYPPLGTVFFRLKQ